MIDKIKSFGIGFGIIAFFALAALAIVSGGLLSFVFLSLFIIVASYFIGSEVLQLHRDNKRYKS